MAAYTERYSGIRVVDPQLSSEDIKRTVAGFCVFKVDKVTYRAIKGKDVVVIGVVIDATPSDELEGSVQVSVWGFERRRCLVILEKETALAVGPLRNGTVVMIIKPKPLFHDERMYLSVRKLSVIGRAKDYGVCGHKTEDGTPCKIVIDSQLGPHCRMHSKIRLNKVITAQASRPELKDSFAGWRQMYDRELKGGKRKFGDGEIDLEERAKRQAKQYSSKQCIPNQEKEANEERGKERKENRVPLPAGTSKEQSALTETGNEPRSSGSSLQQPPVQIKGSFPASEGEKEQGWVVFKAYDTEEDSCDYWKKEALGVDSVTSRKKPSTQEETKEQTKIKPAMPRTRGRLDKEKGLSFRQARAVKHRMVATLEYAPPTKRGWESDSSSC